MKPGLADTLERLARTIEERKSHDPETSYVARLVAKGDDAILKKIGEEATETVLAAKEIAATVNAAMEALPEELRQAVTLREIEGLSYEEIAAAMDCPVGTVRSRIFRAREAIDRALQPLLD